MIASKSGRRGMCPHVSINHSAGKGVVMWVLRNKKVSIGINRYQMLSTLTPICRQYHHIFSRELISIVLSGMSLFQTSNLCTTPNPTLKSFQVLAFSSVISPTHQIKTSRLDSLDGILGTHSVASDISVKLLFQNSRS